MISDAPPFEPIPVLPPDPSIAAEWNEAMKRGRARSRKEATREWIDMATGALVFVLVLVAAAFVVTRLFGAFVTREVEHVSFGDNARTLTVLVVGPLFLLAAPFASAVTAVHFVRKQRRRRG